MTFILDLLDFSDIKDQYIPLTMLNNMNPLKIENPTNYLYLKIFIFLTISKKYIIYIYIYHET